MREKRSCFVIMPYSDQMDRVFRDAIIPALQGVRSADVLAMRADSVNVEGSITSGIARAIETADICIADLTGSNPNVMYELGYASASRKPIIAIAQSSKPVPVDITEMKVLNYKLTRLTEFIPALSAAIDELLFAHERRGKLRNTGFSPMLLHEPQLIEQFTSSARYTLSAVVGSPELLVERILPDMAGTETRGLLLRVVCADPEGEFARMRAKDSERPVHLYREQLWRSLIKLDAVARANLGCRIDLRLTQRILGTSMYISDEMALVLPYLVAGSSREMVGIALFKDSDPQGFSVFQHQFGRLWSESSETSLREIPFGRGSILE